MALMKRTAHETRKRSAGDVPDEKLFPLNESEAFLRFVTWQ